MFVACLQLANLGNVTVVNPNATENKRASKPKINEKSHRSVSNFTDAFDLVLVSSMRKMDISNYRVPTIGQEN